MKGETFTCDRRYRLARHKVRTRSGKMCAKSPAQTPQPASDFGLRKLGFVGLNLHCLSVVHVLLAAAGVKKKNLKNEFFKKLFL